MSFWTYILRCADGSCYTGHTDVLEHRIGEHQAGQIKGYTQKRRPVVLVWSQDFASRIEALESERRIKGWSRAKKEALIKGDWPLVSLLARNRQGDSRPSTSSGRTDVVARPSLPTSVRAELVEARRAASGSPVARSPSTGSGRTGADT